MFRDDTFLPSTVLLMNGVTLQNPDMTEELEAQLYPLQQQIISMLDHAKKNMENFYIITNAEVYF